MFFAIWASFALKIFVSYFGGLNKLVIDAIEDILADVVQYILAAASLFLPCNKQLMRPDGRVLAK